MSPFPTSKRIKVAVIVVDLPNMNSRLRELVGADVHLGEDQKIHYDVLKAYFESLFDDDTDINATAFMNVSHDNWGGALGWSNSSMKSAGWEVYVRPRIGKSDVDENMTAHIEKITNNPAKEVVMVAIVSHDVSQFGGLLAQLSRQGIRAAYVAFSEMISPWPKEGVEVIDLRDIAGITDKPLPDRLRYENIPAEGMYL